MASNYSEFPPPDQVIADKDPKRTLDYLRALSINTSFDMTIFFHQVRAARPARCFEDLASQNLSMVSLYVDSELWKSSFEWSDANSAFEIILQAFIDKTCLRSITMNEMIATCLVSEFLAYPVICEWTCAALASSAFSDPLPLQRLFPWDSQLWIHCCSEPDDRERILGRGLNPALVMCTGDTQDGPDLLRRLCPTEAHELAKEHLRLHKAFTSSGNENLIDELFTRKPHIFGLNQLGYFSQARSSQDSLSFFCEEQDLRCKMFKAGIVANASSTVLHAIDTLFVLRSGKMLSAVSDCSFAYRHRSRQDHEYAHLTEPELRGLVRQMANTVYGHSENRHLDGAFDQVPTNLNGQALIEHLAGGSLSKLDDSTLILQQLQVTDVPFAVFLDGRPVETLLLFVFLPLTLRLKQRERAKPVYVFTSTRKACQDGIDYRLLARLISKNALLRQGAKTGLLQVVRTQQIAEGINIRQVGVAAQRTLLNITNEKGMLLSSQEDALMTLKNLALPWVNIGRASCDQVVALSGLEQGEGYAILHFPPAPLSAGFPVVNKTILESRQGRRPILLRDDDPDVVKESVYGETRDGAPFSGILIKIAPVAKRHYRLEVELSPQPRPLTVIAEQYQRRTGRQVILAWNGGYFVSPKFQENQGFPAAFRGKPVGLVKINRKVFFLPMFDRRPVLAIDESGNWTIQTLNVDRIAIGIQGHNSPMYLARYCRTLGSKGLEQDQVSLYGIQNPPPMVPEGFMAIKFLFDEILQVLDGKEPHCQPKMPHYTLILPRGEYHPAWKTGVRIFFSLDGYDEYHTMIEAGPQLVRAGRQCLDLEREGWTDPSSQALQAAPVHFEDLRTARTVFCTLEGGGLATLTINSRTDESTGLTHRELTELIKEKLPDQVQDAMEFDSGGSVTLLSGQELLNICSTLGHDHDDRKPRSLARPIATAILLTAA